MPIRKTRVQRAVSFLTRPNVWTTLVAVLIALEVLHRMLVFSVGPRPLRDDSLQYWNFGREIANGDFLMESSSQAFRTPGYPYFLALFEKSFGSHALSAVVTFQHLLGLATTLLTAWLCSRVVENRKLGFFLGLGVGLFAVGRVHAANRLHSEALFVFFLTLHFCVLYRLLVGPFTFRWRVSLLAGLTLGMSLLIRPVCQFLVLPELVAVGYAAHLWGGLGRNRTPALKSMGTFVGALFLMVAPWLWRNSTLHGESFLTRFLGRNIWISVFYPDAADLTLPNTDASEALLQHIVRTGNNVDLADTWQVYYALRDSGLTEIEADDLMLHVSKQTIQKFPVEFIRSAFKNCFRFWYVSSEVRFRKFFVKSDGTYLDQKVYSSVRGTELYRKTLRWFFPPSPWLYVVVTLITFAGIAVALVPPNESRAFALALGLGLVYFCLVTAILEVPSFRYRLIIEPLMVVASVFLIDRVLFRSLGSARVQSIQ